MTLKKLTLNRNQKGFTLIELMIVIAIIGILAAIAIPNYISYRDKSFCSAAESDAQALASSLSDYFAIPSNQTYTQVQLNLGEQIQFTGSGTIDLSGNNTGSIVPVVGGSNQYVISVTDVSTRCPFNYRSVSSRWGGAGTAAAGTSGVYTLTM